MSSALAIDLGLRTSALAEPEAPPAPAVAFRVSRRGIVVASALVAGVGCVLGAQLLISIRTADDAFTLQRLQTVSTDLGRQVQVRTEQLEVLQAPQHLAALATAQGLVESQAPSYLRLADGRVPGTTAGPVTTSTATVPVADALLGR